MFKVYVFMAMLAGLACKVTATNDILMATNGNCVGLSYVCNNQAIDTCCYGQNKGTNGFYSSAKVVNPAPGVQKKQFNTRAVTDTYGCTTVIGNYDNLGCDTIDTQSISGVILIGTPYRVEKRDTLENCKRHTDDQGPAYVTEDKIHMVLLTSVSKVAEFDRLQPGLKEAEIEEWFKANADKIMDRAMNPL